MLQKLLFIYIYVYIAVSSSAVVYVCRNEYNLHVYIGDSGIKPTNSI